MFTKSGKTRPVPTIIAVGCRILGDVDLDGELQLDGVVVGKICCGHLLVSTGGTVSGDVQARSVSVGGTIHGEIVADVLNVAATAEIKGDIHCNEVGIARGARVDGRIHRRPDSQPAILPPVVDLPVTRLSLAVSN